MVIHQSAEVKAPAHLVPAAIVVFALAKLLSETANSLRGSINWQYAQNCYK